MPTLLPRANFFTPANLTPPGASCYQAKGRRPVRTRRRSPALRDQRPGSPHSAGQPRAARTARPAPQVPGKEGDLEEAAEPWLAEELQCQCQPSPSCPAASPKPSEVTALHWKSQGAGRKKHTHSLNFFKPQIFGPRWEKVPGAPSSYLTPAV